VRTVQRRLVLEFGDPQQRIGQVLAELVEAARVHGLHRRAVAEYGDQAEPQAVLGVVAVQPHTGGVGGDLADQRGEKLPVPLGEIVGRAPQRPLLLGDQVDQRLDVGWKCHWLPLLSVKADTGLFRPGASTTSRRCPPPLGKSRCDASSSVATHPSQSGRSRQNPDGWSA